MKSLIRIQKATSTFSVKSFENLLKPKWTHEDFFLAKIATSLLCLVWFVGQLFKINFLGLQEEFCFRVKHDRFVCFMVATTKQTKLEPIRKWRQLCTIKKLCLGRLCKQASSYNLMPLKKCFFKQGVNLYMNLTNTG